MAASNFQFLEKFFPDLFQEAKEAEAHVRTKPRVSAIFCRSAVEKGMRWIYANEHQLEEPYNNTLANLMHEEPFKKLVGYGMFQELNLLRKIGNNAAHGNKIRPDDAYVAIKILFRFMAFIGLSYSETKPNVKAFNELLIPDGDEQKIKQEQFERTLKELEAENEKLKKDNETLAKKSHVDAAQKQRLDEKRLAYSALREQRANLISEQALPSLNTELETRTHLIDQMLLEAGWKNLRPGYEMEFEVEGMPQSTNPTGKGYADYVLWGDNGKPLAVIEAKNSLTNHKVGKHQAKLYANSLEKMFGQRPIIFYTNGYETHIWDDQFGHDRKVYGFYTKDELQRLIDRRKDRKDLRQFGFNPEIAGRAYQIEAQTRVAETYVITDQNGQLSEHRRKALLVMATGAGKTRTAAGIVDMLFKSDWVKRVLFLADRNALVKQAKDNFGKYLPHLSAINLGAEGYDDKARLVFSTYPSMLNRIDTDKNDQTQTFGVGHFDLIIIDEAHRSVYAKYGAIFQFFDALMLGLTATPKKHIDTDTYTLFDIEDDNPTFSYNLSQAVKDGFLVPPKSIQVPLKFVDRGIKYKELSEKEKKEYEEKLGDPTTEAIPEMIGNNAINNWLFNTDTVDKVLAFLMKNGLKVDGNDTIGKTIIFAKNHRHAEFIAERFAKGFSQYKGDFLRVIDNYENKAQDLIDCFCEVRENLYPQIAVSVDMMDTGVDAPRVLNLVFFKPVYSSTKFWQMIGRGTRLMPNLFAPGEHKTHFMIMDFCGNLEYFDANAEGIETGGSISLTERINWIKLELAVAIRGHAEASDSDKDLAESYITELHQKVQALSNEGFRVKMVLRTKNKFSEKGAWENLSRQDLIDIKTELFPIISPPMGDNELSRRVDLIMLTIIFNRLHGQDIAGYVTKVIQVANALLKKANLPNVQAELPLLKALVQTMYWKTSSNKQLEESRQVLRELIHLIDKDKRETVYTHFQDELDESQVKEIDPLGSLVDLIPYRQKVEQYIRENQHHLAISKIRNNQTITPAELTELERILFDQDKLGSKEQFTAEFGEQPLGKFVRSILGLDRNAAQEAFASFIQSGNFSSNQIAFIDQIIGYLEKNGTIDKRMLFENPFDRLHDQGLIGVFEEDKAYKIISIVNDINNRAGVG